MCFNPPVPLPHTLVSHLCEVEGEKRGKEEHSRLVFTVDRRSPIEGTQREPMRESIVNSARPESKRPAQDRLGTFPSLPSLFFIYFTLASPTSPASTCPCPSCCIISFSSSPFPPSGMDVSQSSAFDLLLLFLLWPLIFMHSQGFNIYFLLDDFQSCIASSLHPLSSTSVFLSTCWES